MSIKRYVMVSTIDPSVCATAEDGTEIYPAELEPKFCLSSDVEALEQEKERLLNLCAEKGQRIEELEAESTQLKFQLWGRGIIDDPGPKDPDTVDMFA